MMAHSDSEYSDDNHEHLDQLASPPSPPSAAFIEKFLHNQEDAGISSSEYEMGLFRIDSENDGDVDSELGLPALDQESSLHPSDESEPNSNNDRDHWRGSLPLYTTSVDVDFAEAMIVAPVDLEEGNILRIDMGMRRILVVEVPKGGVKSGETFNAPFQMHHTPLSDLEAFRHKAYNDGHYHSWIAKLFGCTEKGADCHSIINAVCCPCCKFTSVHPICFDIDSAYLNTIFDLLRTLLSIIVDCHVKIAFELVWQTHLFHITNSSTKK